MGGEFLRPSSTARAAVGRDPSSSGSSRCSACRLNCRVHGCWVRWAGHGIMKHPLFVRSGLGFVGWVAACGSLAVLAEDKLPERAAAGASASVTLGSAPAVAPVWSWGVTEVAKLAQAKLGENILLSFVQNSPSSFSGLTAGEIVYLHDQGVTDRVVKAMLDQHGRYPIGEVGAGLGSIAAAPPLTAPPQTQATPSTVYVESAPATTVYVEPSPTVVNYGYYPSYPYYGSYYGNYGYYYPSFSFGLGYRGYYGCGYRRGPIYGGFGGHVGGPVHVGVGVHVGGPIHVGGGGRGGGHVGGPISGGGGGHGGGGPVHGGGGGGGGGRHR